MKFAIKLILILAIVLSCKQERTDPFLIQSNQIGQLTDSTQVGELDLVFPNDSVSTFIGGDEFTGKINDIEIYETSGKKLLVLTPFEALDSTSTIKTIRVIDSRFKTPDGISSTSTFGEIRKNYKISGIQNSLRNIIVSVDDINAYFTIDKSELPPNMRYDINLKIDPIQIPDKSKIKDFYIQWY
ncbi:MAG: hypothetical protein HKN00_03660 [Flavobacteriaceae bacterium]|nr:hypothetical protein [Bacteroidia bacterium]MBT8286765.1 hypothetical protein [Bacteroidia bacterium]NNF74256.1 hypothetical protein [Flavobacteriaceae bacterium]NNK73264.1 hypothetical protein [Flavobacteriaceae bacterium]